MKSEPKVITARCAALIASFASKARKRRMTRAEQRALQAEMATEFDRAVAECVIRIVDGGVSGRSNAFKAATILIGWSGSEVWPASVKDEFTDIETRAESAMRAEYAEDAECMGPECLDLIDQLRALRKSFADARRRWKESTAHNAEVLMHQRRKTQLANRRRT